MIVRKEILPIHEEKATTWRSSANRKRADVAGAESVGDLIGHRHGRGDPAVEHDPQQVHHQGPRQRHSHHFDLISSISWLPNENI